MKLTRTNEYSIGLSFYANSLDEFKNLLDDIPDGAKFDLVVEKAYDQRDPGGVIMKVKVKD